MGHPQPQTPVHCDNATAVGIANNTMKRQRSRSMEMRFFWIGDKVAQEMYNLQWHPGQETLADYQSKHHVGSHHTFVRPWYLHANNSPRVLPWAERPSALKGYVGTLKDGYIQKVPLPRVPVLLPGVPVLLPRVPQIQSASHMCHTHDTCYYEQVPRIPTWSDLVKSLTGLGRSTLQPFSLLLV